jgi:hypothetical protein
MHVSRRLSLVAIILATVTFPSWAGTVTIGSLVFANPLSTLQGFEVFNESGPVPNGCDSSSGTPVCTVLAFTGTVLSVTLSDGSTATRTPSGGFSFSPGGYIYGDNLADDQNQSFLFDNSLVIVSATLTGSVGPTSFTVTDGTSQSGFFSTGAFAAMLDLSGAPALAVVDITVSDTSIAPEPSCIFLVATGCLLMRVRFDRFHASKQSA